MNVTTRIDEIIGHLHAAVIQRIPSDDEIIARHIDEALAAARALKAEISNKGN